MVADGLLGREWVEIVLVLEDGALIDSACDAHVMDDAKARAEGFYLAVHQDGQRDFGRAELIGPFARRAMVELLYESALNLGAATQVNRSKPSGAEISLLPLLRDHAAKHVLIPV